MLEVISLNFHSTTVPKDDCSQSFNQQTCAAYVSMATEKVFLKGAHVFQTNYFEKVLHPNL